MSTGKQEPGQPVPHPEGRSTDRVTDSAGSPSSSPGHRLRRVCAASRLSIGRASSPATLVISLLALVIAISSGVGYAAGKIGTHDLKNGAVTSAKIANHTIKARDLSAGVGRALSRSGTRGATGATGAEGAKGDTGATGATGAPGPKGATGADGAQGPKGDAGDTGADGAQGPKGETGATGPAGSSDTVSVAGTSGPWSNATATLGNWQISLTCNIWSGPSALLTNQTTAFHASDLRSGVLGQGAQQSVTIPLAAATPDTVQAADSGGTQIVTAVLSCGSDYTQNQAIVTMTVGP